jgi:hypothetical protein
MAVQNTQKHKYILNAGLSEQGKEIEFQRHLPAIRRIDDYETPVVVSIERVQIGLSKTLPVFGGEGMLKADFVMNVSRSEHLMERSITVNNNSFRADYAYRILHGFQDGEAPPVIPARIK